MNGHPGARIAGLGIDLPDKVVTNDELSATLDTSDDWIRERTGIESRRVGGVTSTMAIAAGESALRDAGVSAADIDMVIVATTTPDQMMPGTSATVQAELGTRGGAHDLNAACAGFVYALVEANALVLAGHENVLVVGADALSSIVDWDDRGTAILFGDAAGAAVVSADDAPSLIAWDLGADGTARHILVADHGGTIEMDGREVFRQAIRAVVDSANRAMDKAGLRPGDIDWFVPHQANTRIVDSAADRLGIEREKAVMVIEETGNTSAASIPLALHAGKTDGRFEPGHRVMLSGFGAGMTWATAILEWRP